jgi:hypothetical protein
MSYRSFYTAGLALLLFFSCVCTALSADSNSTSQEKNFGNKHVLLSYVLGPSAPLLSGDCRNNNASSPARPQGACTLSLSDWQSANFSSRYGSAYFHARRSVDKLWLAYRALLM